MKKRNSKIQEFVTSMGAKVQCAKLASLNKHMLVSGDNQNTVSLWRFNSVKPLQTAQSINQSEISSISFTSSENEIVAGSSRGLINIWDIKSQKLVTSLKGHTTNVSSVQVFPNEDMKNMIVSGSYDTSIKIWDLRQKNCVASMKGHTMHINTIDVSPDSKWIASGSQDGTIKFWEINAWKPFNSINYHDAAVTCVKFNPKEQMLVSGGCDRTVKATELDKFSLITSTKPEAMPAQSISFTSEGKYVLSSSHESLKVWNLAEEAQLIDNIESNWRGVLDTFLSDSDQMFYGITSTPVYFGLWATNLSAINFSSEKKTALRRLSTSDGRFNEIITPKSSSSNGEVKLVPESRIIDSKSFAERPNNFTKDEQQKLRASKENFSKPLNELRAKRKEHRAITQKNQPFPEIPLMKMSSDVVGKSSEKAKRRSSDLISTNFVVIDLSETKRKSCGLEDSHSTNAVLEGETSSSLPLSSRMTEDPIFNETTRNLEQELNAAEFVLQDENLEKFNHIDCINELRKEHLKFTGILSTRLNYLKPIEHWWNSGNTKSALLAIRKLTDNSLIMDALQLSKNLTQKTNLFTLEIANTVLSQASVLLNSKYIQHIQFSIDFIYLWLKKMKEDIIKMKVSPALDKVDLAREERLKLNSELIEIFKQIKESPRMLKLCLKGKEWRGVPQQISDEIEDLLKACKLS